ncbi:MAG: PD-(D/E)XK nuclease family protein [Myxococcales bacterium]|nr:PD-(D/E)XK nuclease family protein [Myxococcales bacterium]
MNDRTPSHLSPSSIKTFLSCPRKYRFRYVDRAEAAFRAVALVLGSAFHDVVGQWLTAHAMGRPVHRKDVHHQFERALRRELTKDGPPVLFDDDETAADLGKKGAAMMDAFLATVKPPDEILGIELPFELELVDPETGEVFPPIIGAVDALVRARSTTELWEMKSAAKRWSDDALVYDLQSTIYQAAMKPRHPDIQPVLIAVTKTERPAVQIERLARGPSDEADLLATTRGVTRAIEAGVDHPVRSWACKKCEYAGICR